MSTHLNALLNRQRDIHGCISRSVGNLKRMDASNITKDTVETRTSLLDQLWAKLELTNTFVLNEFPKSEYFTSGFVDNAENTCSNEVRCLNTLEN